MKNLSLLALCLIAFMKISAQDTLTARVVSGGRPISGASVVLTGDSTQQIALSDSAGIFRLNFASGKYTLEISSVGLITYQREISLTNGTTNLGDILLEDDVTALTTVVVRGKKPLIEMQLDKTIVHVESMINASSGSTLELLDKTPGVMVENGKRITLNGYQGAIVLIDDRPTYMSEDDLANYLRSLPASNVQKLELMSNPPAKYDASGAAIINIVLKKNKTLGIFGNFSGSLMAAEHWRNNASANVQFNYNKLSFYTNLSQSKFAHYERNNYERWLYNEEGLLNTTITQQYHTVHQTQDYGLRAGFDYDIDSTTSLGAFVQANRTNPIEANSNFNTDVLDKDGFTSELTNGNSISTTRNLNWNANLHAKRKFTRGRELSADINYIQFAKKGGSVFNRNTSTHNTLTKSTDSYNLPMDLNVKNMQVDYIHPMKNEIRIETGLRSSTVTTDNVFEMQRTQHNQTIGFSQQNYFSYKESVHAGYLTGQKNWKSVSAKIGLRAEYANITGLDKVANHSNNGNFKQQYFSLFPSAFVSYALDSTKTKHVVASVSRRINRPGFQQLNPFLVQQDDYNFSGGNPLLKPQFMYAYELKYQYKSIWNVLVSWNDFSDIIFSSQRRQDSIFINQPENIGFGRAIMVSGMYNKQITPWWRISTNLTMVRLYLNGNTFGEKIEQELYTGRLNLMQQFKLGKKLNAEVLFIYRHKDLNGQMNTNARQRVNAGVQYEILDGKGSLRLFAEDIFHTWRTDGYMNNVKQTYVTYNGYADSRVVGISFSYRFGKKSDRRTYNQDNLSEEKGRL